jgi:hypothetical protein
MFSTLSAPVIAAGINKQKLSGNYNFLTGLNGLVWLELVGRGYFFHCYGV